MSAATGSVGCFDTQQPGNSTGGASTGIGLGPLSSGPDATNNFSVDASNDLTLAVIGGGPTTGGAGSLGNFVQEPTTGTGGSGYTPDGRYRILSAGGGQPAGAAEIELLVTGGVIVWARVVRPGSGFTSAPTFSVATAKNFDTGATIAGGSGGTVVVTVGAATTPTTVGTTLGVNKAFRRVVAAGAVADGAAVTPGTYLNKSGRALVAGDEVWAVAP